MNDLCAADAFKEHTRCALQLHSRCTPGALFPIYCLSLIYLDAQENS